MSGEKCRLNSTVFASAKGRQSSQPAGCSQRIGPRRPGQMRVTHGACAHDDRRRNLGGGRPRAYGAPACFPDREAERRLIHHPQGADAGRGRAKLRRQHRCAATDPWRAHAFSVKRRRPQTRRTVAGCSPSALCPIDASCIVIIHNKKRWRKWAGRCPARQYL
jgi:hypothetical protein